MSNELLQKAREYIQKPDVIIDLYDFTVVWLSPKTQEIFGYTNNDLEKNVVSLTDVFQFNKMEVMKTVFRTMKDKDKREINVQVKSGKKYAIKAEFNTFMLNGTIYRVGRMNQIKEIK